MRPRHVFSVLTSQSALLHVGMTRAKKRLLIIDAGKNEFTESAKDLDVYKACRKKGRGRRFRTEVGPGYQYTCPPQATVFKPLLAASSKPPISINMPSPATTIPVVVSPSLPTPIGCSAPGYGQPSQKATTSSFKLPSVASRNPHPMAARKAEKRKCRNLHEIEAHAQKSIARSVAIHPMAEPLSQRWLDLGWEAGSSATLGFHCPVRWLRRFASSMTSSVFVAGEVGARRLLKSLSVEVGPVGFEPTTKGL